MDRPRDACLLCCSYAHETFNCPRSNLRTDKAEDRSKLATLIDFRLMNNMAVDDLYDRYDRETVDEIAKNLSAVPQTPPRPQKKRVRPTPTTAPPAPKRSRPERLYGALKKPFRLVNGRVKFDDQDPELQLISKGLYEHLQMRYNILELEYKRLKQFYNAQNEYQQELEKKLGLKREGSQKP